MTMMDDGSLLMAAHAEVGVLDYNYFNSWQAGQMSHVGDGAQNDDD